MAIDNRYGNNSQLRDVRKASASPIVADKDWLKRPTIVGPPPSAIIFSTKKNNAVDIALAFTGANVCAIAKQGPKYIPLPKSMTVSKPIDNHTLATCKEKKKQGTPIIKAMVGNKA